MFRFRLIFLVLFFCNSSISFSQNKTIYVDEQNNLLEKEIFLKRANSDLFKSHHYHTDSISIFKLRPKYCFGKLTPQEKNEIYSFFKEKYKVDTNKTFVVNYIDTLRAKSEYPIKNLFIRSHDSTKEFEITYDDFLDSSKRAFFYYKRWKRKILYLNVYFKNNGHPEQIEDLFWYQDYDGQIKRMFNKISDGLKMIIVHPNGDYYLESSETKLPYDNLFLKKRWDIYKQEFDNKLKALKLNATQPQ